jgi:hypothetical protein
MGNEPQQYICYIQYKRNTNTNILAEIKFRFSLMCSCMQSIHKLLLALLTNQSYILNKCSICSYPDLGFCNYKNPPLISAKVQYIVCINCQIPNKSRFVNNQHLMHKIFNFPKVIPSVRGIMITTENITYSLCWKLFHRSFHTAFIGVFS